MDSSVIEDVSVDSDDLFVDESCVKLLVIFVSLFVELFSFLLEHPTRSDEHNRVPKIIAFS